MICITKAEEEEEEEEEEDKKKKTRRNQRQQQHVTLTLYVRTYVDYIYFRLLLCTYMLLLCCYYFLTISRSILSRIYVRTYSYSSSSSCVVMYVRNRQSHTNSLII